MEKPLIAVINDDPAFLEFMASFLEEETNYEAVVWDDGEGTLPKLRAHSPNLVILDVRLGDQPVGHTILQEMRDDPLLFEIPVIICTADQQFVREHAEILESLSAGVLLKPFDLDELEDLVRSLISIEDSEKEQPDLVG